MKQTFIFLIIGLLFWTQSVVSQTFQSITIDTLLNEKISIRAIAVDQNKLWYAGDKNRFGFYNFKTGEKKEMQLESDSLQYEFRSIAQNSKYLFLVNIGSPAVIYSIAKGDLTFKKVYTEQQSKTFYDSMIFWNALEGIVVGDPTEDCLAILITRDGGKSWSKSSCQNLPKVFDGEAAFAASNTNICSQGNKLWIVTGGSKARVYSSNDKGVSWQVYATPIIQGQTMTGIFTADFYNAKIGLIAGGNYENPTLNSKNKAITHDGGKTWQLIADGSGFGYASCVQFIPKSHGKGMVAVGPSGLFYSNDKGSSWKQLSTDNSLYTIRFIDKKTAIAAGRNKIIRIKFF